MRVYYNTLLFLSHFEPHVCINISLLTCIHTLTVHKYLTQTIFPVVSTTFWMTWGLPNQRKNILWPSAPLSIQADQHPLRSGNGRTVYHSSSTTGSLLKTDLYSKCRDPKQFSSHTIHISKSISNHHWGSKWCYK